MDPIAPSRAEKRTFGVVFTVGALLFAWTIWPIWIPIFLGALLAAVTWPLKRRLEPRFGHYPRTLAAVLTTFTISIASAIVVVVGIVVGRELVRVLSQDLPHYAAQGMTWVQSPPAARLLERFGSSPEHLRSSLEELATSTVSHLTSVLGGVLAITSSGLLTLIFGSLTLYYLLLEGDELAHLMINLVPLPAEDLKALMREFRGVAMGTMMGIVVVGLFQGITCGIGFYAAGVSRPLFWGTIGAVASLIPSFGTALVAVPLAVAQLLRGHAGAGLGLLAYWAIVVVAAADLLLRPWLMKGYLQLHSLLLLLSLFGGIEAFGPIGLLLGPVLVTLFVAMVRIYAGHYRPGTGNA